MLVYAFELLHHCIVSLFRDYVLVDLVAKTPQALLPILLVSFNSSLPIYSHDFYFVL